MKSFILEYLHEIFDENILSPHIIIAFSQGKNKRLALIGDSILNLVVKLQEFEDPNSTTGSIDHARQIHADKHTMQDILNHDEVFTKCESFSCSLRRPRLTRDFTVPKGILAIVLISSYESS